MFFLSLYFSCLRSTWGVFITHTTRVLKPNLEDLFQMRQIKPWGLGAGCGALEGEAESAATAGSGALLAHP